MNAEQARMLSGLQLAYIGDTVHDLLVRTELILSGGSVNHMTKASARIVCAQAQARAAQKWLPVLTAEETDVYKRGRNARAHHAAPKHQTCSDYAGATGFEAVLGYLYLTGQTARIRELYALSQEEACPKND